MAYDHKRCDDEYDAVRMAEAICRELGYNDVQRGTNRLSVDARLTVSNLLAIAVNAERIARWARRAARSKL